jgi:cytidyltransferase-like protein
MAARPFHQDRRRAAPVACLGMMDDTWMLDEQAFAGHEHLDPEFVAAFDRKQGTAPDEAAAEDLVVLQSHGVGARATVVDLGAGTGRFVTTVAPHVARVIAVDVSAPMLERLQQRLDAADVTGEVDVVRSGLLRYEHQGEPADAVHCRNVLHQLPDAFKALALHHVAGMLRPGGVLRLRDLVYDTTPDRFGEHLAGWFAGAVDDPAVGYTAGDLATHVRSEHSTFTWLLEPMLDRAGFDIVERSIHRGAYAAYTCIRRQRPGGGMPGHERVYVDLVGDLFHAGHVELLRAARSFGDRLVVGVLSDDVVAAHKRRPITTLEERVAVVRACRYVDEVVPDAPDIVTLAFLREHDISVVVHGDELSDEAIATVYAEVAAAGLLRLVPRRTGLSTTELVRRVRDRDTGVR